jgi:NADPH-dependent curcumin reductase CurA
MRRRAETLTPADFEFAPTEIVTPGEGQLLIRTRFISLDPYLARAMRNWSGEVSGWADGAIHGRIVGEVLESRAPGFAPGQFVTGVARWQQEQVVDAATIEPVPGSIDPPSLILGILGRSGLTAWIGLHLADPKPGETLLVSAASGPVGSVVGQLAKARGLRVIGTAGGAEKCDYVTGTLGFDVCLDHRLPDLTGRIAGAAPDGIHILFENVGGPNLDATLPSMAQGGRIMLCGLAAHYNDENPLALTNFKALLYRGLTLRGFITAEHPLLFAPALTELRERVASGRIAHTESITDGLEHTPAAYLEMLKGQGIGKRLIRLP